MAELLVLVGAFLEDPAQLDQGEGGEVEPVALHGGEQTRHERASKPVQSVGGGVLQFHAGSGIDPELVEPVRVIPQVALDLDETMSAGEVLDSPLLELVQVVGIEATH